jgi:hypothetical protein
VAANKSTSSASHFDGNGSALLQYRWHCLMQHVQGYSGSHWMLALGGYSLRIAPAAARETGIQTTINKHTCKAGHFDGHGNAPVRNRAHCPMEEVQSFTRSHWTLPSGEYYAR